MVQTSHIAAITAAGLCCGCGTCAGLCPTGSAIMQETPGGLLRAAVKEDTCTGCGLCLKTCPGSHLATKPDPGLMDGFRGPVISAWLAQAADDGDLLQGQSGGAVTALLIHGIRTGAFSAAAVTAMPADGSLRPATRLVTSERSIRDAQKSKYCPVAANTVLREIDRLAGKAAFVGLPCHVHGLMNAAAVIPRLRGKIAFVLGLFCTHVLSFAAMDALVAHSGTKRRSVKSLDFKNKRWRGWPGDTCVHDRAGRSVFVDGRVRLQMKCEFTPPRCRVCFDRLNVFADLSFGDPWLVANDPAGASVILVRSEAGARLLADAQAEGILKLREIRSDDVLAGQAIEAKKKEFARFSAAWRQLGRRPVDYGLPDKAYETDGQSLRPCIAILRDGFLLERATSRAVLLRRLRARRWLRQLHTFSSRIISNVCSLLPAGKLRQRKDVVT